MPKFGDLRSVGFLHFLHHKKPSSAGFFDAPGIAHRDKLPLPVMTAERSRVHSSDWTTRTAKRRSELKQTN
jgi:hypothetical protein